MMPSKGPVDSGTMLKISDIDFNLSVKGRGA